VDAGGSVPPPAFVVPSTPPPSRPPAVAPGDVSVVDFDYAPRTVSVNAGASVRFVNNGSAPHTITALDASFDSGLMAKGDAYTRRFPTPGTFEYFCIYHPNRTGTVRVLDASGSAPAPAAAMAVPTTASGTESTSESTGFASISMIDLAYEPKSMIVKRGTEITWRNTGLAPHTSPQGTAASIAAGHAGQLLPEVRYARNDCLFLHASPGMEATIVVTENVATGAASAPKKDAAEAAITPNAATSPIKAHENTANLASRPDHAVRNAWIVVLCVVALTGVVTLPVVVYGLRSGSPGSSR